MFNILLEGILLGITLAIFIGPTFFALIQTSISYGFRSGLALVLGIFLSDLLFIILVYLGASRLLDNPGNKEVIGIAGGLTLIVFGTFNFFQRIKTEDTQIKIKKANLPLTAIKGFFLNILNPFVFIFWLGAGTIVSSKDHFSLSYYIAFFSGTLVTVLFTDVLKAYIALKLKKAVNPDLLIKINRVAGLILILFGISLIYRVMS